MIRPKLKYVVLTLTVLIILAVGVAVLPTSLVKAYHQLQPRCGALCADAFHRLEHTVAE